MAGVFKTSKESKVIVIKESSDSWKYVDKILYKNSFCCLPPFPFYYESLILLELSRVSICVKYLPFSVCFCCLFLCLFSLEVFQASLDRVWDNLGGSVPAHGRGLQQNGLWAPFPPKAFCDSGIVSGWETCSAHMSPQLTLRFIESALKFLQAATSCSSFSKLPRISD